MTDFVSRAGRKLEHALTVFGLDVSALTAADFGCNVGGFTDCLLRRGAAKVLAVDTAYGTLAWTLRRDPRVVALERTNALHAPPPPGGVDLVAVDLGWTPQRLAVPAALRWLRAGAAGIEAAAPTARTPSSPDAAPLSAPAPLSAALPEPVSAPPAKPVPASAKGRIITLVKPHYEASALGTAPRRGGLPEAEAEAVARRVLESMPELGAAVLAWTASPLVGAKSSRSGAGNREYLALLAALPERPGASMP